MGKGKGMAHFTHFWPRRQPHLQSTFSGPTDKLLRVGAVLAGTDTMLHAVLYSSLAICDSTLNNPFATDRNFK